MQSVGPLAFSPYWNYHTLVMDTVFSKCQTKWGISDLSDQRRVGALHVNSHILITIDILRVVDHAGNLNLPREAPTHEVPPISSRLCFAVIPFRRGTDYQSTIL